MLNRATHTRHSAPESRPEAPSRGPLLFSSANPEGWRLEELLAQLRAELAARSLELDSQLAGSKVKLDVYQKIMSALYEAEGRQRLLLRHLS
ncbi:MAG: hypothetical protein NVS3B5_19090 [Sphingomicrobium sp.]